MAVAEPIHDAAILLPIARFAGIAWLIAAAALLPHTGPRARPLPHPIKLTART